jgi:hypothetical protein
MLKGLMGKIIPIAYIDLKRCFGENWRRIFFASYLNENYNGLLRHFFPSNQTLDHVTQDDVKKALAWLNNRPGKNLNYKKPLEVSCDMSLLNSECCQVLHL